MLPAYFHLYSRIFVLMRAKSIYAALLLIGAFGGMTSVSAQFSGLGNIVKALPKPKLPSILAGSQPISTNLADAVYGDAAKDNAGPAGGAKPLTSLPRSATGGFVLKAGYYQMIAQSYCLHAGTYGPGGGDGYLYAPVKGSAKDAVTSILQNSVAHPEIEQQEIQVLLWAIVSRSKFEDLPANLKITAAKLLTKSQLASLNRNALSVLTSPQLARVIGGAPPGVRQVLEAESKMRSLMSGPTYAYGDLERVAVLAGQAPRGNGSLDTPSGRWSAHPDGYFIRYIPTSYSQTLVQIWVLADSSGVDKVYDPATHIAVPGNTSRQRLAQSGRVRS
jgi:hypothetical protein